MPQNQRTKFWVGKFLLAILLVSTFSIQQIFSQQRKSFKSGEKLTYSISYGLIRGGEAILEVRNGRFEGKPVNHLYLNGRTVGIANRLYNVNDTYQSFTNPNNDLPYKSIRDINENKYSKYTEQTFDHYTRSDSTIVYSTDTGEVLAPPNSNDILSAFYYLRNHLLWKPIEIGDTLVVETYFSDEVYSMKVRFLGYETIRTRLGRINCLKFSPIVITGRVFKNDDDMTVWFSNDGNYLPVRVRFNIVVGSVYCDLVAYQGLMYPFDALAKK